MIESGSIPPKTTTPLERITVIVDGIMSRTPPNQTAWGCLVKINDLPVYQAVKGLLDNTGDILAKYHAITHALIKLTESDRTEGPVYILCDSVLIINALDRTWGPPNQPDQRKIWNECVKIAAPFQNLKYIWVSKADIRVVRDIVKPFLFSGETVVLVK